jgi:hypothetical protein
LLLFGYGFQWLDSLQTSWLDKILSQKKSVLELRQQQQNIQLAKKDLKQVSEEKIAPDDLFSRDETLVNEISQLEDKAAKFGLQFTLSVAGTVAQAPKAPVSSDLVTIPFSMQLQGPFTRLVQFLDSLEHAGFVLIVRSLAVSSAASAADPEAVTASLAGVFYLRK